MDGSPTVTGTPVTSEQRAFNRRGVIAEHYHELQSLGLIDAARTARSQEPASEESLIRTLLQSAEIALYNMGDLLQRASGDLDEQRFEGCATKLAWSRGFHRVLTQIGATMGTYVAWRALARPDPPHRLRLADSPALAEYREAQVRFDGALRRWWDTSEDAPEHILATAPLPSPRFLVLHLARIANHESTIWERPLLAVALAQPEPYDEFTASAILRGAVHEHELIGDTYFMQFRGLHQIPELVAGEINDLLERAIRALRAGAADAAADALIAVDLLTGPFSACLPVLVDNLATHDYHEIRENLGLTSGSHSVGIRYHMFTHLYEQLCEEVAAYARRLDPALATPDAMRAAVTARTGDGGVGAVVGLLMGFRTFIFQWRAAHLHLPRNNLGGGGTKSLTGSPDAIAVVSGMLEHARASDPARGFYDDGAIVLNDEAPGPLTASMLAPGSTDEALMLATGRLTQSSFVDVQERLGFFANRCPFVKPPRRIA
jgi:hypothetical protein